MTRYIIGNPFRKESDADNALGEFSLILHGAPNQTGEFDWRVKNSPDSETFTCVPFANGYESITITQGLSKAFLEENEGKYLYCHAKTDEGEFDSDGIRIFSDFQRMALLNKFDRIEYFDKTGMIKQAYIPYMREEETEC